MRKQLITSVLLSALVASAPVVVSAADAVCGDVNASGGLTTSDALFVLRAAVGQPVALQCPAPATPLVTGLTLCYDTDGGAISCAGTGQDGEFQKGIARSFTDNGNGTITDNKTGLVWEKLANDGSVHDFDLTYSWVGAVTQKAADLNAQSFGGHNDWRVPNLNELHTLLDMSTRQPATWSIFDSDCEEGCTVLTCSCTQPDWHWSSTTYDEIKSDAWFIDFATGYTDTISKDVDNNYLRLVRGGL